MKTLMSIGLETALLLRRDKIFLPVFTLIAFIFLVALASIDWTTEEYRQMLYNIAYAGFHFTGVLVAIFWGTKLIADSKKEGYLELQLATPVPRTLWVFGKFLGMSILFTIFASILVLLWTLLLISRSLELPGSKELIIFAFLTLEWIVVAAIALFFASLSSQATAMFATLCLWILGMTTYNVYRALPPDTPELTQKIADVLARYWDLARLNLSDYINESHFVSYHELVSILAYGLILCLIFTSAAALLFQYKDVASR